MFLLDHVVHFVQKPEVLASATKQIGLHTVNGGKHKMWGTYNSLCYFDLSYIEFIGIFDEALFKSAAEKPYTLHETYKKQRYRNGALRIAVRTTTIENDAETLRALGYDVYGPETFSRTRPDGSILKWKLLHFGHQEQWLDFPFIIQWDEDDEERKKSLIETGAINSHAIGNLRFKEIIMECTDLDIAHEWGKVFDFQIESSTTSIKLKGQNCLFTFVKGNDRISEIIISGAREAKVIAIEGTQYSLVP